MCVHSVIMCFTLAKNDAAILPCIFYKVGIKGQGMSRTYLQKRSLLITTGLLLLLLAMVVPNFAAAPTSGTFVYINEFHYDNDSTDANEFIEIAGLAGIDVTGWSVVLYNGANGNPYNSRTLNGTMGDAGNGVGFMTVSIQGIQNGAPDGIALVDDTGAVVQFLSYEGTLTGASGPATGLTSTNIGVSESSSTDATESLQLSGFGCVYEDFVWNPPATSTATMPNNNQTFDDCAPSESGAPQLLITELVVTPTGGEFIEIYNPGSAPVDLSNVYITDATFAGGGTYYYNIVTGSLTATGGGNFADFNARFPDSATIAPGEYQTIALAGSDDFFTEYGVDPTYELFEDGATADTIPDMREALLASVNNQGGLTNGGEVAILYYWDGVSDLVIDLDYTVWGDKEEAVDKTGVAIDGPDPNAVTTAYLNDTAIASQDVVATSAHSFGNSWQRRDLTEGAEVKSGGNGAGGHDETSENLSFTFCEAAPTPNTASACAVTIPDVYINELRISGSTDAEFFEIQGDPNVQLDGLTYVVLSGEFNPGQIDDAIDLTGQLIPADGFFLAAEAATASAYGVTPDFTTDMNFFGSPVTHLLVSGYNGTIGTDLDSNDDGVLDTTPWDVIVDSVSLIDGDANIDVPYSAAIVGPDGNFTPAGTYRCEDAPTGAFDNNQLTFATLDGTLGESNALTCNPPVAVLKIHEVQGSPTTYSDDDFTGIFDESPLHGQVVTIQGVVVGDFQEDDEFNGFFVQEEGTDEDGDPETSEGIFVFCDAACADVSVGNIVTALGTVDEYFNQTQIDSDLVAVQVTIDDAGNNLDLIIPAVIDFPLVAPATPLEASPLEAYEGMMASVVDTMRVTEYFEYDRYSQIRVWADGIDSERPYQYTQNNTPDAIGYEAAELDFISNSFFIDDGNSAQNVDPKPYPAGFLDGTLTVANGFRGGDRVSNLYGIFNYARPRGTVGDPNWRLHVYDFSEGLPILRADETTRALPTFESVNPRPAVPDVGGTLKVASFNVLNYFSTIDTGADICGPAANQECRGADDAGEFTRQRDKIIAAISEMDADVVGLIEIENDAANAAVQDLVNGLNAALGAGTYDFVATGPIGTDAIRVAFIYQPATVSPVGNFAVLDSSVDPRFIDTKNRPALAQTFEEVASGATFTAVINHLKSKGSACDDVGDPNLNDGAGNCNVTRTQAAEAMVDWLATDPTNSGDSDFLILGDLNAYAEEDPIYAVREGADDILTTDDDYLNLVADQYGYVFDGRWGTLDYALATRTLEIQVTGAQEWHINADEPDALDYDTSFSPAYWYENTPFRSSDHDPVIVGLELIAPGGTITISKGILDGEEIDFSFVGDLGEFTLTAATGYEQTFDVPAGSYNVTELYDAENWKLIGMSCLPVNGADGANGSANFDTDTLTIDLDVGEDLDCEFTNVERRALLKITKNAPSDITTAFTFDGPEGAPYDLADGETATFKLPLQSYVVTEDVPDGWILDSVSCVNAGFQQDVLDVGSGELIGVEVTLPADDPSTDADDVECTFNNIPDSGSITVIKEVIYAADLDVDSDRDFGFSSDILPGDAGNFVLDDPLVDDADGVTNIQVFTDVAPGTYSLLESPNGNWEQSYSCNGDTDGGSTPINPGTGVNIDLDAGEDIVCTFTNTRVTYELTIEKSFTGVNLPADDWDFTLATLLDPFAGTVDTDYGIVTSVPAVGGSSTLTLPLDAYRVGEVVPAGYILENINCGAGGVSTTPPQNDHFTIILDQDLTCVFTNIELGSITVVKEVVYNADLDIDSDRDFGFSSDILPGDAGNFVLDDPLVDDADGVSDTQVFSDVLPGTYTLNESPNGNWIQTYQCTGDLDSGSTPINPGTGVNVDLDAGEDIVCTFTNTRVTYDLTIEKVFNGVNAPGSDWQFTLATLLDLFLGTVDEDFGVVATAPAAGGSTTLTLPLDGYRVGEIVPAGYMLENINCGAGGVSTTPPQNDHFTIILDQDLTCVFTNTELGSITVIKEVIYNADLDIDSERNFAFLSDILPGNDGNFWLDDPLVDDADGITDTRVFTDVPAGTYMLIESPHGNWTQSYQCTGDLDNGSTVINPGTGLNIDLDGG